MTMTQVPGTYVCQLNKPDNRSMLEAYRNNKIKDKKILVAYYKDICRALLGTPAFGKPKTNEMLNALTEGVRATLLGAKKGKISAYAHAGALLNKIDYCSQMPAKGASWVKCDLVPLLTDEELEELLTQGVAA